MSDTTQSSGQQYSSSAEHEDKGKGRAEDTTMGESEEDEEDDYEDQEGEPEEPDEDNMEEIDEENIIGSRTRGKNIDFAKAAQELDDDDEEDEEDDGDFEAEDEEMAD